MALSNFYLTDRGNELMARTLTGEKITITKAQIGEGTWPDGTTHSNITALVAPIKDLAIAKKTADSHGQTKITIQFTTTGIGRSFRWTELGLWAANPASPDDRAQDILLGTSRATADEAVYFDGSLNEFNFNIILKTSSADAVEIIIDQSAVYVSYEDLETAVGDVLEAQKGNPDGLAALDENAALVIKQVDDNGYAQLIKNHSETHDYGSELRDVDKDGDIVALLLNAEQQTVKAKFTQDGVTSIFGLLHEGRTDIPRYMGFDFVDDLNKFTGYRSGIFTSATTANVPDPIHPFYDVWNTSGEGRFFTQYASVVNDDITYYRKYYDGVWTDWKKCLTSAGDSTIDGSLSVNYGSGTFLSYIMDGIETGAALDAYFGNKVGRLKIVQTANNTRAYVVSYDGAGWGENLEIYHQGNAPYEVATAELI